MSWFDTPGGYDTLAVIVALRPAKLTCMPNISVRLLATVFVSFVLDAMSTLHNVLGENVKWRWIQTESLELKNNN